MAGRPAIFDRAEQRKNQIVVPMSQREKERVVAEANRFGMSNAAFVRMLLAKYFESGRLR